MVEVRTGIRVIDDAIEKISRRRCSILVVGRRAAETLTFQLAKSFCKRDKSNPDNLSKFQTIYINFNDSRENYLEKSRKIQWDPENESPDGFLDLYDRRSVGDPDNLISMISNRINRLADENRKTPPEEIVVIVNSLSRLALYKGEDKVLDFLSTMNYLEYPKVNLLVFFFLDVSLHEPLFINKVKSLVDCAIEFREDHEMEITEDFFGLQGFGDSKAVTKWYPCLDMKEYGIVPMDFLEISSSAEEDRELEKRVKFAEARKIVEYCSKEGLLDDGVQEKYEDLMENEKRIIEWIGKREAEYRGKKLKTFRTGIWAIDRIFSKKGDILGGIQPLFGVVVIYDIHLVDMYPVFAKILCQCFKDEKPFIEISIDDNPELFLESLQYSHGMNSEHKKIKEELLDEKEPKFKFINCYGIEPTKELKGCSNIVFVDGPYNITILFSRYRTARRSLFDILRLEEDETGPIIWLNSYSSLASISTVKNAYDLGVNTIMARDVWSPQDEWYSLMLFSMQRGFLPPEDETNLQQVLDGIIEFRSRRVLGNRIYYFRVPKMPQTNKTVAWTPYMIKGRLGFLPLDEDTVYHYLKTKVLEIKGREPDV